MTFYCTIYRLCPTLVDSDYTSVPPAITILLPQNPTKGPLRQISVPLINDSNYELFEHFDVSLQPSASLPDGIEFDPTQAVLEVLDDDSK